MYSFGKSNHVEPFQGTTIQTSNNFVFKLSLAVQTIEIRCTFYGLRDTDYANQIQFKTPPLFTKAESREGSFFERDSEMRPAFRIPND
jgi:hypothetical protein